MSDTPLDDFIKRGIPLPADELRLSCRVVYNTPEGQRHQDFQLSTRDGETTLFGLWLDLQDDIGSWLKKVAGKQQNKRRHHEATDRRG